MTTSNVGACRPLPAVPFLGVDTIGNGTVEAFFEGTALPLTMVDTTVRNNTVSRDESLLSKLEP